MTDTWRPIRIYRRFDVMRCATVLIARRRDAPGEPVYAIGVQIPRERLEDLAAKHGADAVRRYEKAVENCLKQKLANDDTKGHFYLPPGCDVLLLDSTFRWQMRSLAELPRMAACMERR